MKIQSLTVTVCIGATEEHDVSMDLKMGHKVLHRVLLDPDGADEVSAQLATYAAITRERREKMRGAA